ncbi:piggyBac transposable element-derived protein 4 [Bombyx mori]|uniref:PiggyBac transposable element-derived protein domain-containing protein n=1 Tax=Bombyx mori TaxID=7091 RepID=A0A8R2LU79_BOMMO|nr:piggyBac transposable element-derived protein 4-like [Bombyx mori]
MSELDINSENLFSPQVNLREIDLDNAYDLEASGDEIIHPPKKRKRLYIRRDSETKCDLVENVVTANVAHVSSSRLQKWREPTEHQLSQIAFTEPTGIKKPYDEELRNADPGAYFSLIVSDDIFEEIAVQTNLYAERRESTMPSSRLNSWKPTNKNEVKSLFGLIMYMGLVKLPKISLYWSTDRVFKQTFAPSIMSRNRFELLLQNLHFVENEIADAADRIYKIRSLIDKLNKSFQRCYSPKEEVCVDESQVPYSGRLILRQGNKRKKHKCGMKLVKLCTIPGYTYKLELYAGKNHEPLNTTPKNVVMSICKEILDLGHTVATNNSYTSLDLAHELLDRNTHLLGTLRKNSKGLPKQVIDAKLKQGESVEMENERGITVLHWKDERSVLMLSTKHTKEFPSVPIKGKMVRTPKLIIAYNKAKGAIHTSDQMNAYSSPLRKTLKWYKKLGIELILNTAVVNAWIMFCENTAQQGIVEFRRQLVEYLVDSGKDESEDNENESISKRPERVKHTLITKEGKVRQSRRFCVECYKSCVSIFGSRIAKNRAKKVPTYCPECPAQPHYCLQCFNKCHPYTM